MATTDLPVRDLAEELIDGRRRLDIGESEWLALLSDFDRQELWSLDGFFTAAGWLAEKCRMARSTAYEKLRMSEELRRRPVVAEAFGAGELSYSHVRLMARISDPVGDTDRILVDIARDKSVRELERAIRYYQLIEEQERPPPRDRIAEKGAFVREVAPGMDQLCLSLPKEEMAEIKSVISAFIDRSASGSDTDAAHRAKWDLRRAEALQEIGRAALGAAGARASGTDRYMAHVVINVEDLFSDDPGVSRLIDGTPISADAARKMACESTVVAHLVRNGFEELCLGKKTATFSAAQKRAMKRRDQHRCRIPGCDNTMVDCHHVHWASRGGASDISNGICCCDRHHTMIHKGDLMVHGDGNTTIVVRRRDGTLIGFSDPPAALPRT